MLKRVNEKTLSSIPVNNLEGSSTKPELGSTYDSGLNRRAFLRQTGLSAMLIGLIGVKPNIVVADDVDKEKAILIEFSEHSKAVVEAVQMQLFPDDGDGPSAKQLNAFRYLTWALDDPENVADGDKPFILKGVGWLENLSQSTQGDSFIKLTRSQQDKVLKQISQSQTGENWLSLLLYYLLESLTLDPVYGGNPNGIGWQWLDHQPGFPQPVQGKTYLDFS